jgi:hypothetical protein
MTHCDFWLVELVSPPGIFEVRQSHGEQSLGHLRKAIIETWNTFPVYHPPECRAGIIRTVASFEHGTGRRTLFACRNEELARIFADALANAVPDAELPWSVADMEAVTRIYELLLRVPLLEREHERA